MPHTRTDTRIAYADDGEGRPVVLIHGWPLSHRMWEYQVGPLVEAGYRCVAYDRRGFGAALREDRIGFVEGFTRAFFGVGPDGDEDVISEPLLRHFVDMASWASPRATIACAEAFGSTDFTADMTAFDVPTLVVHGDADQTVPHEATAVRAAEMVPAARLEIVEGAPHGLTYTHRKRFNELLLGFLRS